MTDAELYGANALIRAFNTGKPLDVLMNELYQDVQHTPEVLCGAITGGIAILEATRKSNTLHFGDEAGFLNLNGRDLTVHLTLVLRRKDGDEIARTLSSFVGALSKLRELIPGLTATEIEKEGRGPIISEPPKPEPMRVIVESLPPRVTTTEVERDPKTGSILSAKQIERDYAMPGL